MQHMSDQAITCTRTAQITIGICIMPTSQFISISSFMFVSLCFCGGEGINILMSVSRRSKNSFNAMHAEDNLVAYEYSNDRVSTISEIHAHK